MKREQQIEQAAERIYGSKCRAAEHFANGAAWADGNPGWISIEEQMPPKNGCFIGYEPKYKAVGWVGYNTESYIKSMIEEGYLSHWMPLPPAPNVEQQPD